MGNYVKFHPIWEVKEGQIMVSFRAFGLPLDPRYECFSEGDSR